MTRKFWPVPASYCKELPREGTAGSFWENRGDRNHCGIDIYAPHGSEVLAVDSGRVLEVGVFSSPENVPYWNITYYILILHHDGLVSKYAELAEALVRRGDEVFAGDTIGRVGSVLDPQRIDESAPLYVRRLKENGHSSMLHFELYQGVPLHAGKYLGGNSFGACRSENVLDPGPYLEGLEI